MPQFQTTSGFGMILWKSTASAGLRKHVWFPEGLVYFWLKRCWDQLFVGTSHQSALEALGARLRALRWRRREQLKSRHRRSKSARCWDECCLGHPYGDVLPYGTTESWDLMVIKIGKSNVHCISLYRLYRWRPTKNAMWSYIANPRFAHTTF